ncbi:hypothetical protein [Spirochaeta africana]|uniref:Uncharacterized protein n=1 Tax=Spirochaeta africana (strain ATCC 700263 / DSM 8902 / Z-7692) TaxID=889378 RepID=H9UL75_SPIAZ|nr:hypothetical protein [Spirochaeta africana]AFG38268.1 hypothetical protein Spiaf_2232 [Spirochaeta africana DSM 8902]
MEQPDFSRVEHLQSSGFIKTGQDRPAHIDAKTRVALVRKGNELFNAGRIEQARRVFITTGYSDGLIRIGDYYLTKDRPLDAFRMYWLAGDRKKIEPELEKMARVIRHWLQEDAES